MMYFQRRLKFSVSPTAEEFYSINGKERKGDILKEQMRS